MGKRGRPKTPTNLTILRGNPGKRAINKDEPKPHDDRARCPQWLSPEARKIWRKHVPELKRLGLLTNVDVAEFSKYCEFQAMAVEAIQWLHRNGTVYPLKARNIKDGQNFAYQMSNGEYVTYLTQAPQVAIARNYAKIASQIGARFGLTPSDRVNLNVKPKEIGADEFENFLNRKKKA